MHDGWEPASQSARAAALPCRGPGRRFLVRFVYYGSWTFLGGVIKLESYFKHFHYFQEFNFVTEKKDTV